MTSELEERIVHQLEYYFGNVNLPRDKYMQGKMDEDGWITLEVLVTFRRLASLSTDPEIVATAVENFESSLLEVSPDHQKIRRNPDLPIPELTDAVKAEMTTRTAYAKGFPLDELLSNILDFLQPYGSIDYIVPRNNKFRKFKGSCFIIFENQETCKKFVELESVEYKGVELLRKWKSVYCAEKTAKYNEIRRAKKERSQARLNSIVEEVGLPKGAVIYFWGIPQGRSLTREAIKERIEEIDATLTVAFLNFNQGDAEGHVRFTRENAAIQFFRQVPNGELQVNGVLLKLKVLEDVEEHAYLQKASVAISKIRKSWRR